MSEQPQIFTLQQVVSSIRKTIEERYNREYWVKAEMHKLGQTRAGHCYPELVQKEDGKVVAEMRGTIWKHSFDKINERFMEVVKEPLKEDTTLLMKVKVNFHEVYGISLQINDIDPNYALGELQRERAETLKKLQKENLLNANQQVLFPMLPKRVAVISAESSKGLSDFMQVIELNNWNYNFFTMLFPATLQGEKAETTIIAQLENIKRVRDHFDIVVIVRGGGGEVGMSCYNNFNLCKAIASFPIPILTGIGHSTNLTVAEMISYRNAITPTELGDFLIQAFHEFAVPVKDAIKSIRTHTMQILELTKLTLAKVSTSFSAVATGALSKEKYVLQEFRSGLQSGALRSFEFNKERVRRLEHSTVSSGRLMIQDQRNGLIRITEQLPHYSESLLLKEQNNLDRLVQSIRLMDPINVLNRGFSITTHKGKTIDASNKVQVGDKISTRTANFTIESEVTANKEENEQGN
ncbi:MAG: exodeoxyribonuclease VII large subunit [Crocinitomicaceae bacterium]|nr:exodeoxyribonuclease VII large subunit [Crocinitomicaceae bacterium]